MADTAAMTAAKTADPSANPSAEPYDYIVVGSGAGGGPVAANLARAGFRVLLLEAGGRAEPANYRVPGFHPFATEDESLKWDYFVRHYKDDERSQADPKFCPEEDGVLYPRAGTLGGCTAHHAMIVVYPHDSDWDHIAELTGDESWSAVNMRRYFERLERKRYRWWSRAIYRLTGWNLGRHGYDGWLPVTMASPTLLFSSPRLLRMVLQAVFTAEGLLRPWLAGLLARGLHLLLTIRDVNYWTPGEESVRGPRLVPVSIEGGRRHGTRELIESVQNDHPDRLHVATNALATEILFEDGAAGQKPKAVGVRYMSGENLYSAAPQPGDPAADRPEPEKTTEAKCRREVILCAGAFNTPQLLMLSGIGPTDELDHHKIPVRRHRPGVGRNLQDRYEVGVVARMKEPFALLEGAQYRAPADGEEPGPLYRRWLDGEGPYTTNGAVVSVIRRSDSARPEPDLFCFGLVGGFRGYYPGYAQDAVESPCFTWAVLKAHTENRGGEVTLASPDPRDRPCVNFHYFEEGTGDYRRDLDAVVAGVRFCRELNAEYSELIEKELLPGPHVQSDEEIAQFVKDHAWGHHASCSCQIGKPDDDMAVVDSRFRVIDVDNLRVVDASIFPRIPGFFILTSIFMAAEKASEAIIEDAGGAVATEKADVMTLENPRPLFRISAIMLIVGSIFAVGVNLLHPNPHDIGDPIAQLELISASDSWGPIHVGIVVASMIRLGGLVGLTYSFGGGYGAAWARIGLAGAIVGAAAAVVLFAVDGIASQRLAMVWANAPPGQFEIAYQVSQANQYLGFAVYGLWIMVFFGLTYIAFGLAVAFSREYPRWLGWIAVAGGIAGFVIGYFQYFTGLNDLLTNKLFPGCAILLAVWTVVMGLLLWRKASAESGQSGMRPD